MGSANRNTEIVRSSAINILANVGLCVTKMIIGLATGSLVIVIDAINNLTDVLSSVLTIAGTKLSEKPADEKHPYGYGRIEYLTSLAVGLVIVVTALGAIKESFASILSPTEKSVEVIALVIMALAIAVKLIIGVYMRKKGKKINATILIGIGTDALTDALVTGVALVSIAIEYFLGFSVEGYAGVLLSALLLKVGFELCRESVGELIGNRMDRELVKELKQYIYRYEEVCGVYKVALHQYGTGKLRGAAWIAVDIDSKFVNVYDLVMRITEDVREEFGIDMSISALPHDEPDEEEMMLYDKAIELSRSMENVSRMLVPFKHPDDPSIVDMTIEEKMNQDPKGVVKELEEAMKKEFPEKEFRIHWTYNFSD